MTHFAFHDPGWFLVLLALPVVALLRVRRKAIIWVVPFSAQWHRASSAREPKWRTIAIWTGLVALVIALARPQLKEEKTNVQTEGHDVMIAIDVSPSMLSEDFVNGVTKEPVSRLEAVKILVRAFIEQRPNDRIGVVVFAGRAYTLAPLTFDHDWLIRQLTRIRPGLVGDGTAIGDALGVALTRLENPRRTIDGHRAGAFVMLLTDGDNNGGVLSPFEAAEIARQRGISVFTIGAGLDGQVPFPKFDEQGQRIGTEMMLSTLDQMSLVYIAGMTNGKYYRAAGTRSMANAIEQIDVRKKIKFHLLRTEVSTELFAGFAIAGVLAFGLAFVRRPPRSPPPPVVERALGPPRPLVAGRVLGVDLRCFVPRDGTPFPHPMPMNTLPSFVRRLALTAGLSLAAAAGLSAAPVAHPDTTGWPSLFATDLSNADTAAGDWVIENGVLVAKNHETIWTKKAYGNFVLDLEFKVAKESNSGVFLRSGDIKDVLAALEIQVHESNDGAQYGMVGAIYNAQPPAKDMSKPIGEWNHFTITCQDSHVSLIFNGEEVFNVDLNNWKEPHLNADGTKNKFAKALKDFSRSGPIGLQGLHGKAQAPVWYRNIKIKELK